MELSESQKHLLGYSAHDDMGIWVVVWEVTEAHTSNDPSELIRQKSIQVIKEMMENGWIVIGMPVNKDGQVIFQLFSMSVDEAIAFIESEWDKLGKLPSLGDVCWFRATPAGKQLADELGLED